MKLILPKKMFVLTTDSYITAEQLAKEKDFILKGFLISKHDEFDAFKVDRIEYAKPNVRLVRQEKPLEIPGFKVFHGIIHAKPISDDIGVLSPKLDFIPYDKLEPGISFITVIKHIIADVQIERPSRTRQTEYVELDVPDIHSIIISSDESGSSTMMFVKRGIIK